MAVSKRTIKLRQADALGRQFIKVSSNHNDSYPNFEDIFNIQLPTFVFNIPKLDPGEASLSEIFEQQSTFWTQEVTYASFMGFMFENTIFEDNLPTQPTNTTDIFDLLSPDEPHFIGTIDESGNLIP